MNDLVTGRSQDDDIPQEEKATVREHQKLKASQIYQIIRTEGREELTRPKSALFWSGVAAGFSIGFSVLAEALLYQYLPREAGWRPLVDNLGYTVGFIIVVMARQQLFTENTITAILPLLAERSRNALYCTARLWTIVFLANLLGCFIYAFGLAHFGVITEETLAAAKHVAHHFMDGKDALTMFAMAIPAGWLIATMVWLLPNAENSKFLIIVTLTYLIALGEFSHVIAGSVEAFLLVIEGEGALSRAVFVFLLPTFAGNIIGGSALFALISWAQVREEVEEQSKIARNGRGRLIGAE